MKNLKGVFLYLGMGSCVSTKSSEKLPPTNSTTTTTTMEKTVINPVQPSIWQVAGSKEEQFFDSKAWLESDDEDFLSVNGDYSPPSKHVNGNNDGDHQGRRLSDLFKNSSFTSDSQTSLKAAEVAASSRKNQELAKTDKLEKEKSMKRCIPSLVRSLSWRDRKRRPSHVAVAVAG